MSESSRRHRPVELVDASYLSPTVRNLTLRVIDDEPFVYTAGQWINLHVGGIEEQSPRSYSIASAPRAGEDTIEIAVTRVENGPASTVLHELPLGSRLTMDGPWGFFTREGAPSEPAIFVGTGTGLSPLRSMLHEELRQESGAELVLLFGCRTEQDVLWRTEWEALARQHPRFRFEVTLSQPPPGWNGRRGYVQVHLDELISPLLPAQVYVCGLSKMVKDVRTHLKERLKLTRESIHTERYD